MDDDLEYRIRLRAHELWAQGGQPNASALAFWNAAEAELIGQSETASQKPPSLDPAGPQSIPVSARDDM